MSAIKSNKLIPLLAIIALLVVGFIALKVSNSDQATPTESPLDAVPAQIPAPEPAKAGGMLGGIKDGKQKALNADADTPNESLKTLTSEVMAARTEMQRIADENRQLRTQAAQSQVDRQQMKAELRDELRNDGSLTGGTTPAPGAATGSALAPFNPGAGSTPAPAAAKPGLLDPSNLMAQLPNGFGFDGLQGGATGNHAPADPNMGMAPATPRTVLPMGVTVGKGVDGKEALIRTTAGVANTHRPQGARGTAAPASGLAPFDGEGNPLPAQQGQGKRKEAKRYFTIPENATLLNVTSMSAIVGRIPVDGRVTDPMQFKLIIGPENLASNGHFLPRDLSGIIMSGIAIGDMNLQCSEGLIQSMTFVFNDGTIQTVSQRNAGATPNMMAGGGGSGGSSMKGLAQTTKLGYISDRYGNPCIAGTFITNAPAYLTDTIGLKALSLAGEAAAMAQTTVSNSTGFGGTSSTSQVTGNQGKYILGKTAAGATSDVSQWLTKRMGNSFDAIVTMAGADIVVNIDQEIPIDKKPEARRLDYGRIDADNRSQSAKGHNHDFD